MYVCGLVFFNELHDMKGSKQNDYYRGDIGSSAERTKAPNFQTYLHRHRNMNWISFVLSCHWKNIIVLTLTPSYNNDIMKYYLCVFYLYEYFIFITILYFFIQLQMIMDLCAMCIWDRGSNGRDKIDKKDRSIWCSEMKIIQILKKQWKYKIHLRL